LFYFNQPTKYIKYNVIFKILSFSFNTHGLLNFPIFVKKYNL